MWFSSVANWSRISAKPFAIMPASWSIVTFGSSFFMRSLYARCRSRQAAVHGAGMACGDLTPHLIRRGRPASDVRDNDLLAFPFEGKKKAPRSNAAPIRPGVGSFERDYVSGKRLLLHFEHRRCYSLPVSRWYARERALGPVT